MSRHFYRSLEIDNFRGIRELKINDLTRINLFVGRNNCGKTTLLESLLLLTGISDPALMIRVQNLRMIILSEPGDIKDFFFERNDKNDLSIRGIQESGKRVLNIKPYYSDYSAGQSVNQIDVSTENGGKHVSGTKVVESGTDRDLLGLEYEFSVASGKTKDNLRKYSSRIVVEEFAHPNPAKFYPPEIDKKYKGKTFLGRFLNQKGNIEYSPVSVDKMIQEKRKDMLLESLQIIEPKISDIKVGLAGLVSVDIGYDRFLPINLLGDGLLSLLNVVSSIDSGRDGVLMIDEVGYGLHVSCIKHLWKILIEQSRKYNVQIFMTTHSKDVIEGLAKFYEEGNFPVAGHEAPVTCFYLKKNSKDHVKGYRYSPQQLIEVLESNIDIRQ